MAFQSKSRVRISIGTPGHVLAETFISLLLVFMWTEDLAFDARNSKKKNTKRPFIPNLMEIGKGVPLKSTPKRF